MEADVNPKKKSPKIIKGIKYLALTTHMVMTHIHLVEVNFFSYWDVTC